MTNALKAADLMRLRAIVREHSGTGPRKHPHAEGGAALFIGVDTPETQERDTENMLNLLRAEGFVVSSFVVSERLQNKIIGISVSGRV